MAANCSGLMWKGTHPVSGGRATDPKAVYGEGRGVEAFVETALGDSRSWCIDSSSRARWQSGKPIGGAANGVGGFVGVDANEHSSCCACAVGDGPGASSTTGAAGSPIVGTPPLRLR